MFKKVLSIALAIIMMLSVAMIGVSAAQVEIADESADAPAEVGADAGAETGAGNTISFDANSTGWGGFKWIGFHIWHADADNTAIYDWSTKAQRGKDADGDGIWTYDLDAAGITIDGQYLVIFYTDTGAQTYNLLFDSSCIGDTASCNGTEIENPVDSNKSTLAAYWGNADASVNGPQLAITSIGNVVGSALPKSTTKYAMFVKFLCSPDKDGLTNAIANGGGKTAQEIIDTCASALSLNKADVEQAINEAKDTGYAGNKKDWTSDWSKSASSLSDGEATAANETPADGSAAPAGGSSSSGSSSSSNNSSSSSSSSKSGSASSSKTGQDTTVLFIMLGVMVAAAGVIIFARKRENA